MSPKSYFKYGLPYQIRRTPLSLMAMGLWVLLGVDLWREPLPTIMSGQAIEVATRSDGHYVMASAIVITGIAMIVGQIWSWTSMRGAAVWFFGLAFGALESAVWWGGGVYILAFTDRALTPEAYIAVAVWGFVTGFWVLACFNAKDLIIGDLVRYE